MSFSVLPLRPHIHHDLLFVMAPLLEGGNLSFSLLDARAHYHYDKCEDSKAQANSPFLTDMWHPGPRTTKTEVQSEAPIFLKAWEGSLKAQGLRPESQRSLHGDCGTESNWASLWPPREFSDSLFGYMGYPAVPQGWYLIMIFLLFSVIVFLLMLPGQLHHHMALSLIINRGFGGVNKRHIMTA